MIRRTIRDHLDKEKRLRPKGIKVHCLSRIYNLAEDRGQIPEMSNPCRLVAKNRERKRKRFLTEEEFRRLGRVLDEAEICKGVSVHAVPTIRLLLLTGCRKGEILSLGWN